MKKIRLPYVDNAKAVLITLVVNLGVVFLFFWPDGATYSSALLDSLICAATTTTINMLIVYSRLKKMRAVGQMPSEVPVSRLMQKLPQNPFLLGLIFAVVFGILITGINGAILWFYDKCEMGFVAWAGYKLIYTTVLSIKITEFCIFRYVQPDWVSKKDINTEAETPIPAEQVKNPLPKISVFKEMYGSVTGSIAMNIIIGTFLGGVTVASDYSVIINPTTISGIPITGLVFGCITGILVTKGIVKEINAVILATGPAMADTAPAEKCFTWMPVRKGTLMLLVCACVMIFSATALWAIMTLFEISVMNFYQYTIFMTVYSGLLSKPLTYLLTRRCLQADYIKKVLTR